MSSENGVALDGIEKQKQASLKAIEEMWIARRKIAITGFQAIANSTAADAEALNSN